MHDISTISLKELKGLIEKKDNAKLYIIITEHTDRWNELLRENHEQLNISGLKVVKKDLKGIDLSNLVIEDSDFSDSDLTGSSFENTTVLNSKLEDTKMYHANLQGLSMSRTDLTGASFYSTDIKGASFTGSVNILDAYIKKDDMEDQYKTHPNITRRGYRMAEAYEHHDDEDEDYGYH